MVLYQRELWLGGALVGLSVAYFVFESVVFSATTYTLFPLAQMAVLIFIGFWLQRRPAQPSAVSYSLAWWVVAFQGVILLGGGTAVASGFMNPDREPGLYTRNATQNDYPRVAMSIQDAEARLVIEHLMGASLPADAKDVGLRYASTETAPDSVEA